MPTYDAATIAKLLDLTPTRIHQLVKDGVIPKAGRGQFELVGAVQGYVRFLRAKQRANVRTDEQGRLDRAKAQKAEIEVAILTGASVAVSDVEQAIASLLSGLQAQLLALPPTWAEELAESNEPRKCEAITKEGITRALESVADAETSIPAKAGRPGRGAANHRGGAGRAAAAVEVDL